MEKKQRKKKEIDIQQSLEERGKDEKGPQSLYIITDAVRAHRSIFKVGIWSNDIKSLLGRYRTYVEDPFILGFFTESSVGNRAKNTESILKEIFSDVRMKHGMKTSSEWVRVPWRTLVLLVKGIMMGVNSINVHPDHLIVENIEKKWKLEELLSPPQWCSEKIVTSPIDISVWEPTIFGIESLCKGSKESDIGQLPEKVIMKFPPPTITEMKQSAIAEMRFPPPAIAEMKQSAIAEMKQSATDIAPPQSINLSAKIADLIELVRSSPKSVTIAMLKEMMDLAGIERKGCKSKDDHIVRCIEWLRKNSSPATEVDEIVNSFINLNVSSNEKKNHTHLNVPKSISAPSPVKKILGPLDASKNLVSLKCYEIAGEYSDLWNLIASSGDARLINTIRNTDTINLSRLATPRMIPECYDLLNITKLIIRDSEIVVMNLEKFPKLKELDIRGSRLVETSIPRTVDKLHLSDYHLQWASKQTLLISELYVATKDCIAPCNRVEFKTKSLPSISNYRSLKRLIVEGYLEVCSSLPESLRELITLNPCSCSYGEERRVLSIDLSKVPISLINSGNLPTIIIPNGILKAIAFDDIDLAKEIYSYDPIVCSCACYIAASNSNFTILSWLRSIRAPFDPQPFTVTVMTNIASRLGINITGCKKLRSEYINRIKKEW